MFKHLCFVSLKLMAFSSMLEVRIKIYSINKILFAKRNKLKNIKKMFAKKTKKCNLLEMILLWEKAEKIASCKSIDKHNNNSTKQNW